MTNFGFSDYDGAGHVPAGPDMAAFQAERDARTSLLKMLIEGGLYSVSGEAVADGIQGDAGGYWQPYCDTHDLTYPHGGHCPDCIVGVPHVEFQDAHTDYGRSVVRNAMQVRRWRMLMAQENAAERPAELAKVRGGWLRQRRLERQRAAQGEAETQAVDDAMEMLAEAGFVEPGRKRRRGKRGGRKHRFAFFFA